MNSMTKVEKVVSKLNEFVVLEQCCNQVKDQVVNRMYNINEQISDQCRTKVINQVWNQVGAQIRSSVVFPVRLEIIVVLNVKYKERLYKR